MLVGRNADAGVGKRLPDDYVRDQVGWDDHEYPFHTKGDRLYFREAGGRLVFTVGRYLTGSIHLKSNVTIHLGEGAVLVGSTNPYDYDMELNAWYGFDLGE